jgi:hypothetical protein
MVDAFVSPGFGAVAKISWKKNYKEFSTSTGIRKTKTHQWEFMTGILTC